VRTRISAAAALLAVAALALHPLLGAGFLVGHDAWIYPTRLVEFETALADGQFPPVWAAHLGSGHGQPHFQFVPPLLYWLSVPFRVVGFGLTRSVQLPLALVHLLAAAAIYRIARRERVSRVAAVATGAFWLFAPYVALDLYVRSAYAESLAISVAPIALHSLLRLVDRPSSARLVPAALGVAAVLLSHNAIALLFVGCAGALALIQLEARARWMTLAAIVYAVGLTVFFWYPVFAEGSFAKLNRLLSTRERVVLISNPLVEAAHAAEADRYRRTSNHDRHAIEPYQLVWSPWGYGESGRGPDDGMSFAVGRLHLLLAVLGLVALRGERDRARRNERLLFALLAAGGAWLATRASLPLWDVLPVLQYLAFPWRALFLPALFLPLLAIPVFDKIGARATVAAVIAVIFWNLPHVGAWTSGTLNDERYTPESIAQSGMRATAVEEYAPRWSRRETPYWTSRLRFRDGRPSVTEIERTGVREAYQVTGATATVARLAPFFYPGWRVSIDGERVVVEPSAEDGTLEFSVPAGDHRIEAEFVATPVRRAAAWASLGVLGVLLASAVLARREASRLESLETDRMDSSGS